MESVREPLVILDTNLRVLKANRSFYRTFQLSAEETETRCIYDLGNGQWDIPVLRTLLEEILLKNACFQDVELDYEFERIGRKTMRLNARLLYSQGHPPFVLVVMEDVTKRKPVEEALWQDQLIEASHDAIIVMNPDRTIRRWNAGAQELYGWTEAEARGKVSHALLNTKFLPLHRDFVDIDNILQKEGRWDGELTHIRRDGGQLILESHQVLLRDEQGSPMGILEINRDISERRRAEEERAQFLAREQHARAEAEAAERRASFLAEASAMLASSLDYRETLTSVARLAVPRFADWCLVDTLDNDGLYQRIAIAHMDPKKVDWAWELERRYPAYMKVPYGPPRVLKTGQVEIYPEISEAMLEAMAYDTEHLAHLRALNLKSSICLPLLAHGHMVGAITFVSSESGHHYGAADVSWAQELASRAAIAIDNALLYRQAQEEIAERKRAEKERAELLAREQEARRAAEEANRLKDEFLAMVSHELRTPLTAILGWAHMLHSGQLDEAGVRRALETIERNAKVQAQVIEDLLDISRIMSGKLHLDVRAVKPRAVIEAAVDAMRLAAEAKNIRLQVITDPNDEPIAGDPDRLQQVVWNLLSNAIKFTPKGGRVEVRLEHGDTHISLIVKDTGQGIKPDFLPYVFDRFRQADSTITRKHRGLGLGLAIVRHLVELHGGSVAVESPGEGQGSTFTITLPVRPARMETQEPTSVRPTGGEIRFNCPASLRGLRILIVDDEMDTLDFTATVLEKCDAQVAIASSAAEALETLKRWRPDALVSDISMPGGDGYELISKVRALAPEQGGRVPAIALTAYVRVEDRLRALSAGYQMHVPKPIEPGELVMVIASLLGRASHQTRT